MVVFFRAEAHAGEPIKVEGDKRVPAGFFRIGKSFGTLPANRAGYLHITEGMTCVSDLRSPAYNMITSRAKVGWEVRGENMWRVAEYGRGLLIDYPTNAQARAGSCIFIHAQLRSKSAPAAASPCRGSASRPCSISRNPALCWRCCRARHSGASRIACLIDRPLGVG